MKKISFIFIFIFLAFVSNVYPKEENTFTIQELIEIGMKSNPEIMAKKMKTESLYEAYLASKRLANPEIEYTTGDAESYDGNIQRVTRNLSLQQSLENPFKRHYRLQINKKTWDAAKLNTQYLKLDITTEIKKIFYEILFFKENLELSIKKKDSIQKIHQLVQKQAELGEVKHLEALKLSVEMLKAQNDLNEVQTELKLSKARLNTLLGNSLPQDFKVRGELRYVPLTFSTETILEEKLSHHPLIKEKQALVEQARNNINYVRWQRFPDFNLAAFSQKMLHGTNQGIGISLDIPLWDFKSKEVLEAENLARSQSQELQALHMELFNQVQSKLSRLDLSEQTIRLFEEALLKQAQESMRISEVSYHHGEISLIEFLDTQRTYFSLLKDYQESLLRWNLDKAALEKVMGGELK